MPLLLYKCPLLPYPVLWFVLQVLCPLVLYVKQNQHFFLLNVLFPRCQDCIAVCETLKKMGNCNIIAKYIFNFYYRHHIMYSSLQHTRIRNMVNTISTNVNTLFIISQQFKDNEHRQTRGRWFVLYVQ